MTKQEMIRELRRREQALEQTIDRHHLVLEGMVGQTGGYSVDAFVSVSAGLRAAQCTLHAVKSRLRRLESGNPGPSMPTCYPVSIHELKKLVNR